MMWCSKCNRETDERCEYCNIYQDNKEPLKGGYFVKAICFDCSKCNKYDKESDICGLCWEERMEE